VRHAWLPNLVQRGYCEQHHAAAPTVQRDPASVAPYNRRAGAFSKAHGSTVVSTACVTALRSRGRVDRGPQSRHAERFFAGLIRALYSVIAGRRRAGATSHGSKVTGPQVKLWR
jgi:hypothetical protein